MVALRMIDSYQEECQLIENSIKRKYDGNTELVILEAGCGQYWPLDLSGLNYRIIGVDLDRKALNSRIKVKKDLDAAINADLENFDIKKQFDVIYNSFVLEHLQNADLVLDKFVKMLKPGGLLILRLPDRNSVYGFLTRISPFFLHVYYKKYIKGGKNAGKPGYAPYPTYYHKSVSRDGIRKFCNSYGFTINEEYGFCEYLSQKNLKIRFIKIIARMVHILSIGQLPWKYNNLTYILTKQESSHKTILT